MAEASKPLSAVVFGGTGACGEFYMIEISIIFSNLKVSSRIAFQSF